jgi:hypothetical protein
MPFNSMGIIRLHGRRPKMPIQHSLLATLKHLLSSKRACAGSWRGTFQNEAAWCRLQPSRALKTETLDALSATIRLFHKASLSG